MDSIPNTILQNPYRILGVYANSPKKDIVANKGKATALLNVHKPVEYPLDLKGILPPITRTHDMMSEAEAHLAVSREQINYAQFWFLKMTPVDDVAFSHLVAGDMSSAMEIWSKQESMSSLQNKTVCFLIDGKPWLAIETAEKLYEKFGNQYISKIDANATLQMTGKELLWLFIDSVGAEYGMQSLLDYEFFGAEVCAYIREKAIAPIVSKISSEVEQAKRIDRNDPVARKEAGQKLVVTTKEPLQQLKGLLTVSDSQYQMIADKLGLEILQCGIDYFNNSEEDGRHQVAMKLQKYALSIVVGSLAKQRCEENVNILQKIIEELSPEETTEEHQHLQQLIALFLLQPANADDVLIFLQDTCKDIVSVKEKLGKDHPFYKKEATLIAQIALSKSIDALNEVQSQEFPKLDGPHRGDAIKTIRHTFAASWETILWIGLIDTDADFKEKRLSPNKATLKNILEQVDAFKTPSIFGLFGGSRSVFEGCATDIKVNPHTYYTETEMYALCMSISTCKEYIHKFPNGAHIKDVRKKLTQLEDDNLFAKAKNITDFNKYLEKYPSGRHVQEAKARIEEIKEELRKQRVLEIEALGKQVDTCRAIQECIELKLKTDKYKSTILDAKLDEKFFSLCKKTSDYEKYLMHIGQEGKFSAEARLILKRRKKRRNILWILLVIAIIIASFCLAGHLIHENKREEKERTEQMKHMFELAVTSANADLCLKFLSEYSRKNSALADSVQSVLQNILDAEADSLIANYNGEDEPLQQYVDKYSNAPYVDLTSSMEKIDEKLAEIKHERELKEERDREQMEYEMYGTDTRAWNTAKSQNTLTAYYDYLSRYPKGRYVEAANQKIIDLEVQQVVNSGDYGELPSSQKVSSATGSKSTIRISNQCGRTITIMYSGKKSVKIELSPGNSRTIVLPSGSYQVVASASGVRSFYGREHLTGGQYESEYYISTSRF